MRVINGVAVQDNRLRAINSFNKTRDRTVRLADSRSIIQAKIANIPASDASFNILILRRLGGVGDVLMSTVALRGLKEKFPKAKITYATNKDYFGGSLFNILKYNPHINKVVEAKDISQDKFDFAVDITAVDIQAEQGTKTPPNRIDIYCGVLGVTPSSNIPVYIQTEDEYEAAGKLLETKYGDLKEKKLVFINPASNTQRRDVPPATIQQLVNILCDRDIGVVMAHHLDLGINHPKMAKFIGADIRTTTSLMDHCDIVVTHDTAILHLAGALEKKIIGLFGSINPNSRLSHYKNAIPIWKEKSCPIIPCWYQTCEQKPIYKCMKVITAEEIARTALQQLTIKSPTRVTHTYTPIINGELL